MNLQAAEQRSAPGNDFICVHVRLRARAGLKYDEREFLVPLTANHFVGRLNDRFRLRGIEDTEFFVGNCRTLFHDAQSAYYGASEAEAVLTYREIRQAALRLSPPKAFGGNFDIAERIVLDPSLVVVVVHISHGDRSSAGTRTGRADQSTHRPVRVPAN